MKELQDISPASEAGGQTTSSASHMKLLENGRGSETSPMAESSADTDVELDICGLHTNLYKLL